MLLFVLVLMEKSFGISKAMDNFKTIINGGFTVGELVELEKLSSGTDLGSSLTDRISSYADRLPGIDWDKLNLTNGDESDRVK
jgi:hypothetical protein